MINVIQSYFVTIMKGHFNLYEVRIFIKIVEHANQILKGAKGSDLLGRAVCKDGINCNLTLPVSEIIGPDTHDYARAKDALRNLSKKVVEFYDPQLHVWKYTPFISNIRFGEHTGIIRFVVARWLLEYILDFMYCNFSEYNLAAALSLPSAYAVRLYWLTCSMGKPLDYSIPMLRDMLGVGEKYKTTKDFIKRCIAPAEKILENRNLNGFKASKVMERGKVTKIHFEPVRREKNGPTQLIAADASSEWCNEALRHYLVSQIGFTMQGLKNNREVLEKFSKLPDWQTLITKIVRRGRKKRAGKGYFINAMRDEVNTHGGRNLAAEVAAKLRAEGKIITG